MLHFPDNKRLVRITDGDTITILDDKNHQHRIRFYGIDCPESHQDFGAVARKFTADHCFRKTVNIEVKDVDRYGKLIQQQIYMQSNQKGSNASSYSFGEPDIGLVPFMLKQIISLMDQRHSHSEIFQQLIY